MEVVRSQTPTKGPASFFTGDVSFAPVVTDDGSLPLRIRAIRFTAGARTAWHAHALGQTLYVTEGACLVQARGSDIVELHSGDVAHTPPDEWHWHGAAPNSLMTHLSIIKGAVDGERPETEWGPQVTDSEYRGSGQ
jgi:quercetin dioxygenase-like cupin family protein